MRQCNACHITVDSPIRNCPLCATKLKVVSAEPEPETYPDYSKSNEVLGLTIVKLGIISYEDKLTINFTSNIEETSIQRYFIRHLTSNGVDVCVTVNGGSDIETV